MPRLITGATRVYALLGRPVRHSRSPALHNAWFAAHDVDAVYVALEVPPEADDRVLDAVDALGLAGANLTTPLKERLLPSLALDPTAEAVGAVNLLVREGPRWIGANTDAEGFCRSVEARGVALADRVTAVIGTGGAARAVASGLAGRGSREVRILGRTADRARAIAERLSARYPKTRFTSGPIADGSIAGVEILAVATAGRADAVGALDPSVLAPRAAWVDLNYWDPDPPGSGPPPPAGAPPSTGPACLRWQAALSFERWIGILPEPGSTGISDG